MVLCCNVYLMSPRTYTNNCQKELQPCSALRKRRNVKIYFLNVCYNCKYVFMYVYKRGIMITLHEKLFNTRTDELFTTHGAFPFDANDPSKTSLTKHMSTR